MPERRINRDAKSKLRVFQAARMSREGALTSRNRCRAEHKPGYFTERCIRPLAHLDKHVDKNAKEF